MLTKEDIIAVEDIQTETLAVPEWGGEITLRQLTASEADAFELRITTEKENIRARLCAMCIVGDDGKRLFKASEIDILARKSRRAIDRIFTQCQHINGYTQEDVEELEKNSETGRDESSPSA